MALIWIRALLFSTANVARGFRNVGLVFTSAGAILHCSIRSAAAQKDILWPDFVLRLPVCASCAASSSEASPTPREEVQLQARRVRFARSQVSAAIRAICACLRM